MKQKSPSNVKKVPILTFNYPILLGSVSARRLMQDFILFQKLLYKYSLTLSELKILMLELN